MEIKKCKKCGKEPKILWHFGKFYMFCSNCDTKNGYEDVIKAWNCRQNQEKHGYWEKVPPSYATSVCSNCYNYWISTEDKYDFDYCPHCGAKMNKEISHE